MLPDVWLASSALAKVRRKLPDWGRAHLITFAQNMFHTTDLDKDQLNLLIEMLKEPGVTKPTPAANVGVGSVSSKLVQDVVLVTNPGELGIRTEHYMAGRYAGLRFGSVEDLTVWAVGLLWTAKEPWSRVFATWRENQRLAIFKPSPGASIAADFQKVLDKRRRMTERETMALPTRPTLRQAYWGFNVGDELRASVRELVLAHKSSDGLASLRGKSVRLDGFFRKGWAPAPVPLRFFHPNKNLVLKVTAVKPNTETAPVVTLEEQ